MPDNPSTYQTVVIDAGRVLQVGNQFYQALQKQGIIKSDSTQAPQPNTGNTQPSAPTTKTTGKSNTLWWVVGIVGGLWILKKIF